MTAAMTLRIFDAHLRHVPALVAIALAAATLAAHAQTGTAYPEKSVRLVVPFGFTDRQAFTVAGNLERGQCDLWEVTGLKNVASGVRIADAVTGIELVGSHHGFKFRFERFARIELEIDLFDWGFSAPFIALSGAGKVRHARARFDFRGLRAAQNHADCGQTAEGNREPCGRRIPNAAHASCHAATAIGRSRRAGSTS